MIFFSLFSFTPIYECFHRTFCLDAICPPLSSWLAYLLQRNVQLTNWITDCRRSAVLRCTWLPGLFFPHVFVSAVIQQAAQQSRIPLNDFVLDCQVLDKDIHQLTHPPKEGVYINGLYLQGKTIFFR